ncbi:MAG: hypothetical protein HY986_10850 [Candidatus Melainabacteria bacterium]|nr:hypothetical protein [Candidatus Melainabacteria bacterium]
MSKTIPASNSGSFESADVTFLLRFLDPSYLEIVCDSEGQVVAEEVPPTPLYQHYFHLALDRYKERLAKDLIVLAAHMVLADCCTYHETRHIQPSEEGLVIASLARAGTPLGVLLARTLRALNVPCRHYSIGLCPVTGVDQMALDHILQRYRPEQLLFFDGWTAKGAVFSTLAESLRRYSRERGVEVTPRLYCLSDLAGVCTGCATREDYLIPSSLLNATGCGLISRTFTTTLEALSGTEAEGFHYAFYFNRLESFDLSRFFIDSLWQEIKTLLSGDWRQNLGVAMSFRQEYRQRQQEQAQKLHGNKPLEILPGQRPDTVSYLCQKYETTKGAIKPGITEATRAMLRRNCGKLVLKDLDNADVRHLLVLASEKNVRVIEDHELSCQAAALLASK